MTKTKLIGACLTIVVLLAAILPAGGKLLMADEKKIEGSKKATFAGGCFWCMQSEFDPLPGIITTFVGYTGGKSQNPDYEQVSSGMTYHAEAIEIIYDPIKVNYEKLLDIFWRNIDPTQVNGQFADRGHHYRTAIFYHDEEQRKLALETKQKLETSGRYDGPIVTEIVPASAFYPAEEYHQKYYKKNAEHYKRYKIGSGRAGYLKEMWGSEK